MSQEPDLDQAITEALRGFGLPLPVQVTTGRWLTALPLLPLQRLRLPLLPYVRTATALLRPPTLQRKCSLGVCRAPVPLPRPAFQPALNIALTSAARCRRLAWVQKGELDVLGVPAAGPERLLKAGGRPHSPARPLTSGLRSTLCFGILACLTVLAFQAFRPCVQSLETCPPHVQCSTSSPHLPRLRCTATEPSAPCLTCRDNAGLRPQDRAWQPRIVLHLEVALGLVTGPGPPGLVPSHIAKEWTSIRPASFGPGECLFSPSLRLARPICYRVGAGHRRRRCRRGSCRSRRGGFGGGSGRSNPCCDEVVRSCHGSGVREFSSRGGSHHASAGDADCSGESLGGGGGLRPPGFLFSPGGTCRASRGLSEEAGRKEEGHDDPAFRAGGSNCCCYPQPGGSDQAGCREASHVFGGPRGCRSAAPGRFAAGLPHHSGSSRGRP